MVAACSGSSDGGSAAQPTPFPTEDADASPTPFAGAGALPLSLVTPDGETLSASVYGDGAVVVILAHMRSRDQGTWTDFAQAVAAEGHTAVTFDFRGYGSSSGTRDQELDTDLVTLVEHFTAEGSSGIIIMGASMGGTAALKVASEWNLAGVASLSAPDNFQGLEAEAVAELIGEPALLVAAADDAPFADHARAIHAKTLNGRLQILTGSGHGTNLFQEHPDLTQTLLSWIDEIV